MQATMDYVDIVKQTVEEIRSADPDKRAEIKEWVEKSPFSNESKQNIQAVILKILGDDNSNEVKTQETDGSGVIE